MTPKCSVWLAWILNQRTIVFFHQKGHHRASPGGPVVKTLCFQCRGAGSIPGQGTNLI